MEIAAGIHRIESPLGVRFMAQYVLVGDARTLLFDTGMPDTPAGVLRPYLESVGLGLESLDDVLISHADLDHSGGNRALRDLHPGARFACHELDRRWIESNDAMVAENYLWHEPYGFDEPDEAERAELEGVVRRRRADRPGTARWRDDQARRRLARRDSAPARAHIGTPRNLGPTQPSSDRDRRSARAWHLRARRHPPDPTARLRPHGVPGHNPGACALSSPTFC